MSSLCCLILIRRLHAHRHVSENAKQVGDKLEWFAVRVVSIRANCVCVCVCVLAFNNVPPKMWLWMCDDLWVCACVCVCVCVCEGVGVMLIRLSRKDRVLRGKACCVWSSPQDSPLTNMQRIHKPTHLYIFIYTHTHIHTHSRFLFVIVFVLFPAPSCRITSRKSVFKSGCGLISWLGARRYRRKKHRRLHQIPLKVSLKTSNCTKTKKILTALTKTSLGCMLCSVLYTKY